MTRVLCTGDLGFICSHVARALRAAGYDVIGADIKRGRRQDVATMTAEQIDGCDIIIHHAGQSSLAASRENPQEDIYHNIIGTLNLLNVGKEAGVKHFIFASTSAVYADAGRLTEETPLAPRVPYGITKLAAEFYIRQSDIPHTIFRYANVYGEGQARVGESGLIPHCLEHLIDGKPFAIHGGGNKARDFIHVDDVVAANIVALERRIYGVFNLGTETPHTVNDVCAKLAALCNKPNMFLHDADRAGEAQITQLVSLKFRTAARWQPRVLFEDGLARTVRWWKEEREYAIQ